MSRSKAYCSDDWDSKFKYYFCDYSEPEMTQTGVGLNVNQKDSHVTEGTNFSIFNNTYLGDDSMFVLFGVGAFLIALCCCRHQVFQCMKSNLCGCKKLRLTSKNREDYDATPSAPPPPPALPAPAQQLALPAPVHLPQDGPRMDAGFAFELMALAHERQGRGRERMSRVDIEAPRFVEVLQAPTTNRMESLPGPGEWRNRMAVLNNS